MTNSGGNVTSQVTPPSNISYIEPDLQAPDGSYYGLAGYAGSGLQCGGVLVSGQAARAGFTRLEPAAMRSSPDLQLQFAIARDQFEIRSI